MPKKVIISCAVTGAIHTPSMSPYLPLTPEQIIEQAVDAAEAGAAVLHLHARDPRDGRPVADPEVFRQFVPEIMARTNAVVNITTGDTTATTQKPKKPFFEKQDPKITIGSWSSVSMSSTLPSLWRSACTWSIVSIRPSELNSTPMTKFFLSGVT